MVMLLTATLLWSGCFPCAQVSTSPVSQAKHCCKPSGECRKTKDSSSTSRDCAIQPYFLAKTVATPDHAVILVASVVAKRGYGLALEPPQTHLIPDLSPAVTFGSPPDLSLLHSVFRI
jgi:hypothetical protein